VATPTAGTVPPGTDRCVKCDHTEHADLNAAAVVRTRGQKAEVAWHAAGCPPLRRPVPRMRRRKDDSDITGAPPGSTPRTVRRTTRRPSIDRTTGAGSAPGNTGPHHGTGTGGRKLSTDPKLLLVSKGSGEIQRHILEMMAAQSVGHLGMPLNVIRAGLPDVSDRLIDRAMDSLTRLDLIEAGPVPEMRRLVDREMRAAALQNQQACRTAAAHLRALSPGGDPQEGEGSRVGVERPDHDLVADLIAKARAARPATDDKPRFERDHAWDAFAILDQPYRDDVPLEVQALSETTAWLRRLARLVTDIGRAVIRVTGAAVRNHTGFSDDQAQAFARRAQDQRRWLAYVAEVRTFSGKLPASQAGRYQRWRGA